MIKQGISSLDSMFPVPGEPAAFEENRPVPHGEIRIAWRRYLHDYASRLFR